VANLEAGLSSRDPRGPRACLIAALACALLGACARKSSKPPDQDIGAVGVLDTDERLLFEPSGDPEGLLGRPVRAAADGSWEIEDQRAPGCEVTIRKEPRSGHAQYFEDAGRVASVGVGRGAALGLQAKYGKNAKVELSIDHTEILRADLTGTCGEKVITRVKVGTGRRDVLRERGGEASAGVPVNGVTASGKFAGWQRAGASQTWDQPQAWAFAVGTGTTSADDLKVFMKPRVKPGERFTPEIEVARDMWLIVLYRDANGDHGVVLPDADPNRAPIVIKGGSRVVLPEFIAESLPGHEAEAVKETLLIFGFPAEGDFKSCRPPPGILTPAEANAYATELQTTRLGALPRHRWTSTSFGYLIEPAN
jgi:hypothetical protein